ncbi:hypothetical protein BHF71_00900 [Vulcanibacillus modesticaldus]|uniref:Membrane fusion protein biotin-lipoyl like domain-containing protein n=1 Tax=Vulcanibacillus modesticaldus TaxID=337097 RepID=A0A1D2YVV7_9BACI|nr:HlyD family efflux transporter periplasmic adaptor subunit [Vulcanibacillus modesticaldus]OEF99765.1 hypothetical protein BHF71_00900 [Vulcanibacillus modesticaldus]
MDRKNKRVNKGWYLFLILFLVVSISFTTSYYWYLQANAEQGNFLVSKVAKDNLYLTLDNMGVIKYAKEKEITSSIPGIIEEIYVQQGDRIKAGDPILKLDDSNLQLRLKQAYSELKVERLKLANLLQTTIDKIGNTSIDQLTNIRAPIDGIVEYTLEKGVYINGNTEMLTIIDKQNIYFEMDLYSSDLNRIKVGQEVEINLHDFSGSVTGTIEKISNTSSNKGGMIVHNTLVKVKNPGLLKPGMKGTAHIKTQLGTMIKKGSFVPPKKIKIYSNVTGKIKEIYIDNGVFVKKGTPLLKIDDIQLLNQVEIQKQVITSIQLKIKELKMLLNDLVITSPIEGVIKELNVAPSQNITPNTKILRIVDDNLIAVTKLDQQDITKVRLGQETTLLIPGYSKGEIEGKVTHVSEKGVTKNGHTFYDVEISFPQDDEIKIGMMVETIILVDVVEDTLLVPTISIFDYENGKAVKVIEGDKVIIKKVDVGVSNGTFTQVKSGLKSGELIIIPIKNIL